LHHEAQKGALTQNEQSLISDEKAFLSQAGLKKSFRPTLNERKQMSTKTSIKRIALVAVSALGFGLLSVAPSSAAVTSISVTAPSVIRAGSSTSVALTVTNAGDIAASANTEGYKAKATTVPTGSGIEAGDIFAEEIEAGIADDTDETLTLGRDFSVTAGVTGTELDTSGTDTCAADAATDVSTVIDDSGVTGSNIGDTPSGTGDVDGSAAIDANGETACAITDDFFTVAGSYTFFVWNDANDDNLFDAGEKNATITFVVGGAPTSVSLTPTATSAVAGVKIGVKIYLTDASGRATDLSGNETMILTKTVLSGSGTVTFYDHNDGTGVESDITDGATVTLTTADDVQDDLTYWRVDADNSAGGTWRVTANLGGSLDPLATAATTGTLSTIPAGTLTKVAVASTTGITMNEDGEYEHPDALVDANDDVNVVANPATAGASISFTLTGTAGSTVSVTLADDGDTTLPTGVTAGDTAVTIGSAGTATFTVTATAVADGNGYTLTFPVDAGTAVYDVEYDAATVSASSIDIAELPTGVSKAVVAVAGTSTYTATVKDEFGVAYSNYVLKLTTTSTSRNASKSITAVTNASGVATVSYADASTSTTTLTDAVTLAVYAPSDLATNIKSSGNTVTNYFATSLGSLTLAGGTTALATVKREVVNADAIDDAAAATAETVAIDNTLLDSNNASVSGYAAVYTGSAGLLFVADTDNDGDITDEGDFTDALSTVTVANDNQVFVLSTKTGVGTITVTSGGFTKTATVTFTQVANGANARNIAISASSATATTGKYVSVSATVTDGHGNALEGSTVTFIRTGGRFVTGASSVNVTTDANGVASIDVTADAASSVSVSASLPVGTHAESDDIADTPVTGYAAASGAKSTSITFAVSTTKSDEVLAAEAASAAAEAASDAAAEAIDAANAATDAANLAAEAADAATVAAEEARDAADAATAAVEELATQVATLMAALKAQITTLANTVAKIAKKVKA
jgi:hypothetical protein